ncbi:hypothetical protein CEXT_153291 [Caerostris extrusa]|uniref:Uncharacterized protein n=1 Tax=Caerostris extrusa TaxID=172846 RepID=A0AAV4N7B3_CAEEX|nr:hypothetical protein CEXT_153291 [Caerostris extrusa]
MAHVNTHRKHPHISWQIPESYTIESECIAFVVQPTSLSSALWQQTQFPVAQKTLSRAYLVGSVKGWSRKEMQLRNGKISIFIPQCKQ